MVIRIFLTSFLMAASFLHAEAQHDPMPKGDVPYAELDALIASTERIVASQKSLRDDLKKYAELHAQYLKDMDNRELLLKTAKVAQSALERIKQDRLGSLFDPNYLSEMTLFAKIAARPTLPKKP